MIGCHLFHLSYSTYLIPLILFHLSYSTYLIPLILFPLFLSSRDYIYVSTSLFVLTYLYSHTLCDLSSML
ncbi:hypothetical protein BZA77DRAFT_10898 [Pyronema omphalodes]|nr:hypothetical protein BZA77DRAFT_10898 [Pyronema omphalodes]